MKKMLIAAALLCSTSALANDAISASLCGFVAEDNRNQVRKVLSDNKLNLRNIYSGVRCNNESLLQLAIRRDALDTGTFIVKQMPAKVLADANYEAWATANGFADNPLVNIIKARLGE
ncbi:DUF3718 domain-containing protein [Alishewanella sp. BS5-314]|uniref:DUF3718 domain-containing protein n=1 Tax=Alishewanella sp. BS5-314 TaxID=2755587 RepID=UPI0021BA4F01|nr:DUF3718 domain-containing protein [Alishewanella sp. BS5-314]MCT8125911.1 DUF3718 domain-containing protein [Alishewanella sp. BS5-314]